jgi:hypothetical protein
MPKRACPTPKQKERKEGREEGRKEGPKGTDEGNTVEQMNG